MPLQQGLLQGAQQLNLYGALLSLYNYNSFRGQATWTVSAEK